MLNRLLVLCVAVVAISGCVTESSTARKKPAPDPQELSQINTRLGLEYARGGQYEQAVDRLEKALDYDGRNVDAHVAMALVRTQLGEVDLAEKHYREALALRRDDGVILNNFGQFMCRVGKVEKGEELLLRATELPLYPTPEAAWTNAAACALIDDREVVAEERFRKALTINPRLSGALFPMARISYEKGEFLSARGYLHRLAEVANPQSAAALLLGVKVERALGNKDAEASYALLLRKRYPNSDETQELNRLDQS